MAKILIFTDNHFCENSSIIRKFGTRYPERLENQLRSLNWAEKLAKDTNCSAVVCLGDFFQSANLTDVEITATKDIQWNDLPHYFLVGNHESSSSNLQYNSTKILETANHFVISTPSNMVMNKTEICFLPYIVESDRKLIDEYFGKNTTKRIILSHNDIAGIQMGMVQSKVGFTIEDIEASCDLYVNGHLHNGQKITNKIINLGNLTGQNFGEDALRYKHNIMILDTDTLSFELIENPYAFNFYKLEILEKADVSKLQKIKSNAVLSIKCIDTLIDEVKKLIADSSNILESRLIIIKNEIETPEINNIADLTVDHLAKFIDCCHEKIDNTSILDFELAEICK